MAREGWPVAGRYFLSMQKSDSAELLMDGLDPIYVIREESTSKLGEIGDSCRTAGGIYLGPKERLRLIAEMLGVDPRSIEWKTLCRDEDRV